MSDERLLFDRKLLRARRARFAPEIEAHEFLLANIASEITERLALMLRPFPLALDLGAYHGLLGRRVAELPSVGAMIYAESVFDFAALCPRPLHPGTVDRECPRGSSCGRRREKCKGPYWS